MNKSFRISERALTRLVQIAAEAAARTELADQTPDEEALAYLYDAHLTEDDVRRILPCSEEELRGLPVPPLRVGTAVRYSQEMLGDYIQHALFLQADADAERLTKVLGHG